MKASLIKSILIILSAITISSCGSTATVYGQGKGKFIAKSRKETRSTALNDAIAGANEACEKITKIATIIKETVQYDGEISEDAHKIANKAKDLIGILSKPGTKSARKRGAVVAGMSRTNFSKHFKAISGMTPGNTLLK